MNSFIELSHPEHAADIAAAAALAESQLIDLARQIRAWQEARNAP